MTKAACERRYLSMSGSLSLTSDPSPLHPTAPLPQDAALGKVRRTQSLWPLSPLSSVPLESTAFRVEAALVPTSHCPLTPPWKRAFA